MTARLPYERAAVPNMTRYQRISLNHLEAATTADGRVIGGEEVARVIRRVTDSYESQLPAELVTHLRNFAGQIESVSIPAGSGGNRKSSLDRHDLQNHIGEARAFAAIYVPLTEDLVPLDSLKLLLLLITAGSQSQ